jgi:hypothetical protein
LVVGFKTILETRIAMPEKAMAAIMSTIREEAPIFYRFNEYKKG